MDRSISSKQAQFGRIPSLKKSILPLQLLTSGPDSLSLSSMEKHTQVFDAKTFSPPRPRHGAVCEELNQMSRSRRNQNSFGSFGKTTHRTLLEKSSFDSKMGKIAKQSYPFYSHGVSLRKLPAVKAVPTKPGIESHRHQESSKAQLTTSPTSHSGHQLSGTPDTPVERLR